MKSHCTRHGIYTFSFFLFVFQNHRLSRRQVRFAIVPAINGVDPTGGRVSPRAAIPAAEDSRPPRTPSPKAIDLFNCRSNKIAAFGQVAVKTQRYRAIDSPVRRHETAVREARVGGTRGTG